VSIFPSASSEIQSDEWKYNNIGGWLILVTVGLCVSPLLQVWFIVRHSSDIQHRNLAEADDPRKCGLPPFMGSAHYLRAAHESRVYSDGGRATRPAL